MSGELVGGMEQRGPASNDILAELLLVPPVNTITSPAQGVPRVARIAAGAHSAAEPKSRFIPPMAKIGIVGR